jgi:hypothetical protein
MVMANSIPRCQVEAILPKDGEKRFSVARVRVNDTGISMKLPVGKLLEADWIGKFSANDVALLATVNASDVNIQNITERVPHFPYGIIYLTALFSVMLVTTNLIGDSITTINLPFLLGRVVNRSAARTNGPLNSSAPRRRCRPPCKASDSPPSRLGGHVGFARAGIGGAWRSA